MFRTSLLCMFIFLITACAQTQKSGQTLQHAEFRKCPDERLEMCTREYLPVCATRDTNVRCVSAPCATHEQTTYGNGCTACADEKVLGYIPGACTTEPEAKR